MALMTKWRYDEQIPYKLATPAKVATTCYTCHQRDRCKFCRLWQVLQLLQVSKRAELQIRLHTCVPFRR